MPTPKNASPKPSAAGFSLIELLVVVVVVGIIAGIAIPNFTSSRKTADRKATISNLRVIHSVQANYLSSRGRFARLSELNQLQGGGLGTSNGETLSRNGYVYEMSPSPNPPDGDLRTFYEVIATRNEGGGNVSRFSIAADGMVNQIENGVYTPLNP